MMLASDTLGTFAPKMFPLAVFFKLAKQKGNDRLLPKRKKIGESPTSFWREHAPKNTLYLKNRASLANKGTVPETYYN